MVGIDLKREQLTPRQAEVMALLSGGLANREIALRLGISEQAVKAAVSRLLSHFGVRNRAGLVRVSIVERNAPGAADVVADMASERRPGADAGIVVFDTAGRVLLMNDLGTKLAGSFHESRSLQQQMAYYDVRDPETGTPLEPHLTPVARALAGETVTDGCFLIRRPGAVTDTLLRTSVSPLRDSRGRLNGAVALFWQEPVPGRS